MAPTTCIPETGSRMDGNFISSSVEDFRIANTHSFIIEKETDVKHSVIFLCALVMTLACVHSQAHAQGLKIGYVNSAKVLLEFPEAIDAQKKLDVIGQQWQDQLEKMDKELKVKYEDFQKKEQFLKDEEKRAQRDELVLLQQKGVQYQQDKFGSRGELARATDSLLQPIKLKVM